MDFENPIRESNGAIYTAIQILQTLNTIVTLSATRSMPLPSNKSRELMTYLHNISIVFSKYLSKWFNNTTSISEIIENFEHVWVYDDDNSHLPLSFDEKLSYNVKQVWKPTGIRIYPRRYVINWSLLSIEYFPIEGFNLVPGLSEDDNIPYADDENITRIIKNPRAAVKEKIRRARIKATACNLKLAQLTEAYYEKYGSLEHIDKDSPLSSDLDSNTE